MLVSGTAVHAQVDVYTTWAKVTNCSGGGQCGTCIVEVRVLSSCVHFVLLRAFAQVFARACVHAACLQDGSALVTSMCSQVVADPEGLLGVRNDTEAKKLRKVCIRGVAW